MALMSFAHLKQKKTGQEQNQVTPPGRGSVTKKEGVDAGAKMAEVKTGGVVGVVSFAHLKKSPAKGVVQESVVVEDEKTNQAPVATIKLQRPAGIVAMKTALLAKTNYCAPCPRFWPADENEMAMGVLYGRCCRSGEPESFEVEVWRIIPARARVSQCRYHRENKFEEGLKKMKTKIIWEGVEA